MVLMLLTADSIQRVRVCSLSAFAVRVALTLFEINVVGSPIIG